MRIADHITNLMARTHRNTGKGVAAVVGEVLIHIPCPTEVVRPLDQHRCRSERFECNDQMCEVELRLKIELDSDVLYTVLRLPPGLLSLAADPSRVEII